MYYAYVLKSIKYDYYYKGHCGNLQKRLVQHNAGMTDSLRPYLPVELLYSEAFETEEQTIKKENILNRQKEEDILQKN